MTKHFPPDSGRKHPAHFPTVEVFNRRTALFVTVCTEKRKPLLARPEIHELLRATWHEIGDWLVGDYILLPDHLHFLCAPASPESPALVRWVKYWKSVASRRWPFPGEPPIWQIDFWDTQLRDRAPRCQVGIYPPQSRPSPPLRQSGRLVIPRPDPRPQLG